MSDVNTTQQSDIISDLELFERYLEESFELDLPERGDLREGTIVEIRSNEILVNIGSKRDGVVPQSDIARLDSDWLKSLNIGDPLDVVVGKQQDDEAFQLSVSLAFQRKDWLTANQLLKNGEISSHKVIGYNKGGVTVDFNHIRGFVPASHLMDMPRNPTEEQRQSELEKRINKELRLKVIEVDESRRRLVMSEMLAEREYRAKRREEIFSQLSVGDEIEGTVRSMRPFGVFVDLGGVDGLLHVSEIGWNPVNHPREVLKIGDEVNVKIIRIDTENQRIALSRKRMLQNPWESLEERYGQGEVTTARITRVVDFGAFAELEPGIEGLIHISELADITIAEPLKTVKVGDTVDVKILRVDARRKRIGLSIRQAQNRND
ncbi:MAG: S1 RNA-binding domain-containing protein [Chloroflexota bacterium]